MEKFLPSRLIRKQEKKNLRRAILFGLLSLLLILSLLYLGIPALIKLSIFLGNLRSSYLPSEQEDTIPPTAPILSPLAEATFSAEINLSGFAEPGAMVEIFVSGISQEKIVAGNDSTFSVGNLKLTEGTNEIYATATDKAGNISQPSEKIIVVLDKTPPTINILEPKNKTIFYGNQKAIEIKGEIEEGTTVTINDHLVIVGPEGKFSYPLVLSLGENKIKIVATDKAGNQTEEELTVFLE